MPLPVMPLLLLLSAWRKCVHIHYTVKEQNIDFILLCISETAARTHTHRSTYISGDAIVNSSTHIVSKMLSSRDASRCGVGWQAEAATTRKNHTEQTHTAVVCVRARALF